MLSAANHTAKEYAERGVQTELYPRGTPSPPSMLSQHINSPSQSQLDDVCPVTVVSPSLSAHSRSSTQNDGAYTEGHTDMSFDSTSSSVDRSMTTTTRAYKIDPSNANRPKILFNRHPSSRIVSLPEATPSFRMKNILEKKTARVVTMPAVVKRDTLDSFEATSIVGDPFTSEDEGHTRVRVRSQATDVPHTPSAPSSPDSVVIIANNSNQLSSDFLRHRVEEGSPPESDEEGWITWTKSPPRPIPALHGPLSLPYARCPSGAEGTIIEEQESLPRVIWGLESDETTGARQHIKGAHSQPPSHKPSTHLPNDSIRLVPKTKPGPHHSKIHVTSSAIDNCQNQAPQETTAFRAPSTEQLSHPPDFVLKHSEPIDLTRLMGNTSDSSHQDSPPDYASQNASWQTSVLQGLPTPELVHDLSPELQAVLFAQERLRHYGLSPAAWASSGDSFGSLSALPSSTSSTSLLESLKSSRSPICLEDLAPQNPSYSQRSVSRASALDIAQKYRQQQFQHGLLPTPPDSTSPIWSSTFSPYQGGLLSPELLAAAGLSPLNSNYLASQAVPSCLEPSQQLLRPNPVTLSNPSLNNRHDAFSQTVHINNASTQRLPPRLIAEYARRRTVADALSDNFQLQNNLARQFLSPACDLTISPTMPKAPPNTPHGATPPYGLRRLESVMQPSFSVAASPTSARDQQNFGLPQHARSVPLSRLVQRRLSTVPEEDYSSSGETGRTPPASGRTITRGSATSSTGLHLFFSPTSRPNVSAERSLGDTLEGRYGSDEMGMASEKRQKITPGVKLPGVTPKVPRPVSRGETYFVKEAYRRQGSNINSDGGRRGDSGRGRGQKRGGRGRKGRGAAPHGVLGAERIDGGIVVKS